MDRTGYVGGSDVAAVLGLDRFRDAVDVYLEKTRPPPEREGTPVDLLRGQLLEPVAAELYERDTGRKLRRMGQRRHRKHEWAAVHADRQILSSNGRGTGLLELKCPRASTVRRITEEGLFPSYSLQTQWGMWVCEYDWGSIGVMNLETEPPLLHVDVDADTQLMDDVASLMHTFYHDHVLKLNPPDAVKWGSWGKDLKIPKTDPALREVTDAELLSVVASYAQAKAVQQEAKDLVEKDAEQLRELLASRGLEAISTPLGKVYYRWSKPRRTLDRKRLEQARLLDYAAVLDVLINELGPQVIDTDPRVLLVGCELDLDTLEKVGEPYRSLRYYPTKEAT